MVLVVLSKIISGGQTGADQAGLAAGRALSLQTGGHMPKGFRTQVGPRPDMQTLYGMQEHHSYAYPPRTELNVINSDATLIFGDPFSKGCTLTKKLTEKYKKPCYIELWPELYTGLISFKDWLLAQPDIKVLNVAGNREESMSGIYNACYEFLIKSLRNE